MAITVKRVYEPPNSNDGVRVLVDRLWPRGLSKANVHADEWLRNLAPSTELRKWFHANPSRWQGFRNKYLAELSRTEANEDLNRLYGLAHGRRSLTLLFASKSLERNNALMLKELLEGMRKPPNGTGPCAARSTQRSAAVRPR